MQSFSVQNADNLITLTETLLSGQDITDIDFSKFSKINVKIDGDNYSGDLTASICQSLNHFHNSLSKLYCLVKYGEENLNRLSEEDKNLLNITFYVSKGCTEWKVDIGDILENISKYAVDKMNPIGLSICIGIGIVGYFGNNIYDRYATMTENIATQNNTNEIVKEQAIAMKEMAKAVTTRSQEMYVEQLRIYDNPKEITFQSGSDEKTLDQDEIQEVTKRTRRNLVNEDATKAIEIDSIKRSLDKIIVTARVSKDYTFPIYVDTSFIDKEEIDLLFDAFKENRPVFILADFKSYQGKIEKGMASAIMKELPKKQK